MVGYLLKAYLLVGGIFALYLTMAIFWGVAGTFIEKLKISLIVGLIMLFVWPFALIGLLFIKDDTDDH